MFQGIPPPFTPRIGLAIPTYGPVTPTIVLAFRTVAGSADPAVDAIPTRPSARTASVTTSFFMPPPPVVRSCPLGALRTTVGEGSSGRGSDLGLGVVVVLVRGHRLARGRPPRALLLGQLAEG